MGSVTKRWPVDGSPLGDQFGRVWTDLEELKPWVVLLRRPYGSSDKTGSTLVFRAADEEFTLPVSAETHLEELGDELLRSYLRLARAH